MATKAKPEQYVTVLISHDALEVGDRFRLDQDNAGWVLPRVEAGYLELDPGDPVASPE